MKHKASVIFGLLVAIALGVYLFTFRVRFNEGVVVTTFGKAEKGNVLHGENNAGLHFRWPWPIQDVRRFDTRLQVLDDRAEEQETKDKQIVIVRSFVTWRISEPLDFYQKLANLGEAEKQLRARLRDARSVIGQYSFDALTNVDPRKLLLDDVEQAILDRLRGAIQEHGYGIQVETVGIKRLLLPEPVTEKVAARMRATRKRMAKQAVSEGEAKATEIRSTAENARERILSFADRRAKDIRAKGLEEAAKYYQVFQKNEELAIYLRKIAALKETLKHRSTFLLDTQSAPFDLFEEQQGKGIDSKRSQP